ncbi:hypothetical protein ID866_9593 [Astraeus odoratus]|nr:hypothetical protein ID866_9593 [Astraeus odoratus]
MEISQLTEMSDGLFEWARLACEFIKLRKAGLKPKRRFAELVSRSRGQGSALLDGIYSSILNEIVHDSLEARTMFQSVMRQVLWTAEPLPITSLNLIRQYFQAQDDVTDVKDILDFMAALLSGIIDHTTPVRPLHSSFYDYLTDVSRSGPFYVDRMEVHLDLALASMKVMQVGLRFNICGLESSYVRNSDVQNLEQRVRDCIPPHLTYACQYWAYHLQQVRYNYMLVKELRAVFLTEYIVFWMEVLSLVRSVDTVHCAMPILMAWVGGHHDQEALSAISQDAIKFMQTFGGAMYTSTPHLYISALALCPTSSSILGQVMHKFRGLPQVMTGQQEEWPAGFHCRGHSSGVLSAAFSPNNTQIVSGSGDGTIRVWDAHTGAQIGSPFEGHTGHVNSVTFSPDGRWIVSGSYDKTIRLWDVHIGSQIGKPFEGHAYHVYKVSFSPDGGKIVSGSLDRTIRIWDVHTGSQIGVPFEGHTGGITSVSFSPDSKWIVSGSLDNTIRIWDVHAGSQIGSPFIEYSSAVYSVAFSPDGKWIVSGARDNTIRIWDAHSGSQIGGFIQEHTGSIMSVAFSPDGRWIVSGSEDEIRVWDAHTGSQIGIFIRGNTSHISSVAFSPDGRWIVSGSGDKTITLWDVHTGSQIGTHIRGHTRCVNSVSFSPDGRWIVSGSCDKTIRIWDIHSGSQLGNTFQGHTDSVQSVCPSPDGSWIVSASNDCTIRLWDVHTSSQIGSPFQGHVGGVVSAVFSPDDKWIVSGSHDMTVRVWDAHIGSQMYSPFVGHTSSISSVSFSPNGRWIVSGSDDKTIRIWGAYCGCQIGSLVGHTGNVNSVSFSPNGRWIVSGSDDKTIRVWEAHAGSLKGISFARKTGSVTLTAFFQMPFICFSSERKHSLCNVHAMYDGVDCEGVRDLRNMVKLNNDGWITGPGGKLLLWIPGYYHAFLYSPKNALVIPRGGPELNLSMMVHGHEWHDCYIRK